MTTEQISELFDNNSIGKSPWNDAYMKKETFLRIIEEVRREELIAFNKWHSRFFDIPEPIEIIEMYLIETKTKRK